MLPRRLFPDLISEELGKALALVGGGNLVLEGKDSREISLSVVGGSLL